jgi:hypothetical protein
VQALSRAREVGIRDEELQEFEILYFHFGILLFKTIAQGKSRFQLYRLSMKFVQTVVSILAFLTFFAGVSMASPFTATVADQAVIQKLAQTILRCGHQTVRTTESGRQVLDPIQSTCPEMRVTGDRVVIQMESQEYTLTVRDSENSDGGDLVDLFLQYDSRKDLEVAVAQNLLAFGDPAEATLIAAGLSLK